MKPFRTPAAATSSAFAALARGFALVPLLLLLLGAQVASGVHHHEGEAGPESCPVCVHAHAPAIGAGDVPSVCAPKFETERPLLLAALAPVSPAPRFAFSRGPPRA